MKLFFSICISVIVLVLFSCSQENKTVTETSSNIEKVVNNDTLATPDVKNISDGEIIYHKDCLTCHGADGKKKHSGAKDLSISVLNINEIIKLISSAQTIGDKLHSPRFPEVLSDDQIKEVGQYIITLRK